MQDNLYENPWIYNNVPLLSPPDSAVGFVYLISDTLNDKLYIGKKLFFFSKSYQLKGKKKKKQIESDWKLYYGSNKSLLNVIQNSDPSLFNRSVLHIAYSKSHASYLETKEIFANDAILSPKFYNDWVTAKITRKHMQKFQFSA